MVRIEYQGTIIELTDDQYAWVVSEKIASNDFMVHFEYTVDSPNEVHILSDHKKIVASVLSYGFGKCVNLSSHMADFALSGILNGDLEPDAITHLPTLQQADPDSPETPRSER